MESVLDPAAVRAAVNMTYQHLTAAGLTPRAEVIFWSDGQLLHDFVGCRRPSNESSDRYQVLERDDLCACVLFALPNVWERDFTRLFEACSAEVSMNALAPRLTELIARRLWVVEGSLVPHLDSSVLATDAVRAELTNLCRAVLGGLDIPALWWVCRPYVSDPARWTDDDSDSFTDPIHRAVAESFSFDREGPVAVCVPHPVAAYLMIGRGLRSPMAAVQATAQEVAAASVFSAEPLTRAFELARKL